MEQSQLIAPCELSPDAANSALPAGTVLQNRYRIVRQLGRGGMGAVYEALDQRLEITVALKETLSSDASVRKQFEHEARLLAGMQHPALPRVSDHFVEGNRAFLVMQFIGGVDLARIISQQPGPFPRDSVIVWADQLLDALIYLHSRDRQVIHRDIKPHNLKLTGTGQIALLDFGLAKAQTSDSSSSVTSSRAFFGYTRHYAPLEQIQDQRTDPRSDIYALGATLYHLLTGIKPPDAMVRATALLNSEPDPLKPANEIHEAVGPAIAAILRKAMAQKPEDRYASASEFREALRRMGRTTQNGGVVRGNPATPFLTKTIHIDQLADAQVPEATVVKLALVESASRFGHGAITFVLVVVITLTAGVLYGSQGWFQSVGKATAAKSANDAATQRLVEAARKSERARASDNNGPADAKTRDPNDANTAEGVSENRQVIAPGDSQVVNGRGQDPRRSELRRSGRRINAPSIHLPILEFRDTFPAPSPSRNRAYDSSGAAPRFFRAPDGATIVKFSDGSTRVVRPGERSARSGHSQR